MTHSDLAMCHGTEIENCPPTNPAKYSHMALKGPRPTQEGLVMGEACKERWEKEDREKAEEGTRKIPHSAERREPPPPGESWRRHTLSISAACHAGVPYCGAPPPSVGDPGVDGRTQGGQERS